MKIKIDNKVRRNFIARCTNGLWSPATARLVALITEAVNGYQQDGRRFDFSSEEIDIFINVLELLKHGKAGRAEIIQLFRDANIPVG